MILTVVSSHARCGGQATQVLEEEGWYLHLLRGQRSCHRKQQGRNEGMLGFCPSGESSAFLSGQQNTSGDRNLFLIVSEEQEQDFNLVNNFSNQSVFGFGNCFVKIFNTELRQLSVAI